MQPAARAEVWEHKRSWKLLVSHSKWPKLQTPDGNKYAGMFIMYVVNWLNRSLITANSEQQRKEQENRG